MNYKWQVWRTKTHFFDWNRLPYPKYTRNTYLVPFIGIYQRKTAKNRRKTAQFLLFGGYKIRQTSEPVIIWAVGLYDPFKWSRSLLLPHNLQNQDMATTHMTQYHIKSKTEVNIHGNKNKGKNRVSNPYMGCYFPNLIR